MPAFDNSNIFQHQVPITNSPYTNTNSRHHRSSSSTANTSSSYSDPSIGLTSVPLGGPVSSSANPRLRIYPKEISSRSNFLLPNQANASPLLNALTNPSELLSFLSTSGSNTGAYGTASSQSSLGAGSSPPSSWPASFSPSNGNRFQPGSASRGGGYAGFEESLKGRVGAGGQYGLASVTDVGCCCSLDTLDDGAAGENVVVLGWHGGLDVLKLGRGVLELIGRIEGLSGSVHVAKIIPSSPKKDGFEAEKPLIAVISVASCPDPNLEAPPSPPLGGAGMRTRRQSNATAMDGRIPEPVISHYQTSVDIFSLSSRKRIATLFTSPVVAIAEGTPVKPWGGLKMEVAQNTVVLGVGLSGETYVFSCAPPKSSSRKRTSSVGLVAKKAPVAKPVAVAPPPVVVEPPSVQVEEEIPAEKASGKKKKKGRAALVVAPPPPLILPTTPPVITNAPLPPPPPSPPKTQQPAPEAVPTWVCLAKVWTALQFPLPPPAPPANAVYAPPPPPQDPTPIFSLSTRHLAFSPLPANSSIPAGGTVGVPVHPQGVYSVNSTTPPTLPKTNVVVDQSGGEGWKGKIARELAGGIIRGAKWVGGEAGRRVMGYWSGPGNGQNAQGNGQGGYAGSPPQGGFGGDGFGARFSGVGTPGGPGSVGQGVSVLGQQLRGERQNFYPSAPSSYDPYSSPAAPTSGLGISPPTPTMASFFPEHQLVRSATVDMVSLLDLQKPLFSGGNPHSPSPLASFRAPTELSFLSFAPGGLMLVTANKAGDVVFVWDLMRVLRKSSSVASASSSASITSSAAGQPEAHREVRLLSHYTRLTASHIISVTWNPSPEGSFTVLTEKGTVHFYNLPSESLRWPPPPKRVKPRKGSLVTTSLKSVNGGEVVKEAVRFVGSSAMPLVRAGRDSVFSTADANSSIVSPSSAPGASGVAKKMSAAGGKVSLPGPVSGDTNVRFLVGKESGFVAIIGGGKVRVYKLLTRRKGRKGDVGVGEGVEFDLPGLPRGVLNKYSNDALLDDIKEEVVTGFWSKSGVNHREAVKGRMPLSYAEIDTNASVRPFYLDRRVVLEVFVAPSGGKKKKTEETEAEVTTGDWCFGGEITARKLNILGKSGGLSVGNGEGGQEGFFEDGCEVLDQLEL
ncbi:hypothetical protein BJ508DRAFT_150335 [Ascobolus immersus RN42]|uniref:WD40 repeat-like protein n=1 Tax=Ascobolus immersus RN42 TaxID=1160509 RepID=A0A3N4HZC7_ASCIM|nr:hypothetical protein BJ508DRAFT_150335 [Ascobolus immersus RN42]